MVLLGWSTTTKYTIDPTATGNVVRSLFAAESVLNILVAGWLLLRPSQALSYCVSSPSSITPLSETLTRYTGLVFVVVTVPLFQGIWQTPTGIEARPITWTMYVAAEVMMISMFYTLAGLGEERVGLKPEMLRWLAQQVAVPMVGRIFTLVWKPQWLGRYIVEEGTKRQ